MIAGRVSVRTKRNANSQLPFIWHVGVSSWAVLSQVYIVWRPRSLIFYRPSVHVLEKWGHFWPAKCRDLGWEGCGRTWNNRELMLIWKRLLWSEKDTSQEKMSGKRLIPEQTQSFPFPCFVSFRAFRFDSQCGKHGRPSPPRGKLSIHN